MPGAQPGNREAGGHIAQLPAFQGAFVVQQAVEEAGGEGISRAGSTRFLDGLLVGVLP